MQNEALREAQSALEESRESYVELYEFAPVGYLTIHHSGKIDKINLTGATLLGEDRSKIINCFFWSFVAKDDLANWHRHILNVLANDHSQATEISLRRKDGSYFYARLECARVERPGSKPLVRIVLSDVTRNHLVDEALRESEARFRVMLENDLVGIATDKNGEIQWVNPAFERMLGYEKGELRGAPTRVLYPDETTFLAMGKLYHPVISSGKSMQTETEFLRKDGRRITVKLYGSALNLGSGESLWIYDDITERKQAEIALRDKEHILSESQRIGHVGSWHYELFGKLTWSEETYRLYGVSPDNFVPSMQSLNSLIHPEDRNAMREWISDCANGNNPAALDFRILTPEGHLRILKAFGELQFDSNKTPKHLVGMVQDITERKKMEEEMRQFAFYDSLTGLPNRRLLAEHLKQTLLASKRNNRFGALIFLDLDNFKPLNDAHGHDVGDLLLIEAAKRISGCVRETDTAARFGGDEFVVMLGELDLDRAESLLQARIVAEKIRVSLAELYLLTVQKDRQAEMKVEHHCTSSIGVVLFPGLESTIDDLFKWADSAMYKAKEDGRNLIRFYDAES
jgi:diguanylate cyclase (GGDEF)-like protein/PAS domain S-box-containing protein